MRGLFIVLSLVLMLATATGGASAQATEGKFQIELSTDLIAYNSMTMESDLFDDDITQSQTKWGVHRSVLLDLGYGITDMIVLGAYLQLGGASQTVEEGDEESEASDFVAVVGPKLDVLFSPAQDVRPFVGIIAGLATQSDSIEDGPETSMFGFNAGTRVGLHWFASTGFSLSPAVMFAYTSMSGEVEFDGPMDPVDISQSGFMIGLMLGASGWM